MITCFDCDENGLFLDLDDIINMSMDAQRRAMMGVCPLCGSVRTEG